MGVKWASTGARVVFADRVAHTWEVGCLTYFKEAISLFHGAVFNVGGRVDPGAAGTVLPGVIGDGLVLAVSLWS